MRYRDLGTTGIRVSEIGFGAWAIGGRTPGNTSYGVTDDETSLKAIETALDAGINLFDTANIYGNGHSEELLGQALLNHRSSAIIASKCGMKNLTGEQDFTPQGLRASVEASLRRLRTDYLDLLQLHDCPPELANDAGLLSALEDMRKDGKFLALGVSVKSPQHAFDFLQPPWQTIQCNFNMIDQRALQCGLFAKAATMNVGIIARTPLAFGFLSGKFMGGSVQFADGDHRTRWPAEQLRIWAESPKYFAHVNHGKNRTLSQLALQFCVGFSAVASVIPGITTPAEALENARVGALGPLSHGEVDQIIRVGQENQFFVRQ